VSLRLCYRSFDTPKQHCVRLFWIGILLVLGSAKIRGGTQTFISWKRVSWDGDSVVWLDIFQRWIGVGY
jgi:hypothetical protein